MATSVGTVFVDVRFNVGDLGTQLRRSLGGGGGAAPGTDVGADVGANMERGLGASLARLGTLAQSAGRQLMYSVSLPLVLLGKSAVSSFAAFDAELTKMNALVGVSRSQTDAWAEDVKSLGHEYVVTASEGAKALYFITSSGVEGAKAIETLAVAEKGAAVGLGDVQTVADATTSAMNAYGQSNLTAAKAADILTVAVREGKGEADQMAGALSNVIPIASAVGVSYGEVAGAMSAMTLSGTSADEAATQLRALLNTLQDMPPIAQKALKQYTGLDYAMVRQKLTSDGLIPTLQEISEAFGDNQVAVGEVFGNIRALTGIQNLFGAKTQQTLDIVRQTTNANGDLARAFDATAQSASFKLNKAMNDLKISMTEAGASIIPMAEGGAAAVGKLAQGFAALDPAVQKAVTGLGAMLALSGPLLYSFGSIVQLGKNMGTALTTMSPGLANFGRGVQRTTQSINAASTANNGMISQLGGVNQILGATAIAIGGVVAAQQIWNATMAEATRMAKGFVQSVEAQSTGKSGFAGATEQIDLYDQALNQVIRETATLSSMNPFDKKKREQLKEQWRLTMEARDALGKLMEMAGRMAGITGNNRDAILDWLMAQKAQNKEYPTAEAAIAAYNKALAEGEPDAKKAASASVAAAGSLSAVIAKAKTASDAYNDMKGAQRGYRDAQRGVVEAEEKVADARKAYVDAQKATIDSERKISEARRKAVEASKALAEANLRLADAHRELNEAREGPSEEEKIDVESAKLSLADARARLSQPFENSRDRRRAKLDVRRAQLEVARTEAAHEQRVADAVKNVADAEEAVADAQQSEVEANAAIVEAIDDRSESLERERDARRDIVKAQEDLVDARDGVLDAYSKMTIAQQNMNDALHSGAVDGQAFMDYLDALKKAEPALSAVIDKYKDDFRRLRIENEPKDPYGGARPPSDRLLNAATRATGGPLVAGQLSTVNERGMPELWVAGGKQYLLPVASGTVVPLEPSVGGGTDGPTVGQLNVYVAGDPVQNAYEVRRQLRTKTRTRGRG